MAKIEQSKEKNKYLSKIYQYL